MTISADYRNAQADLLARSLELYRDLTVALRERITLLTAGDPEDADCKKSVDAIKSHHRALQTVLDLEASLGKHKPAYGTGEGAAFDLDAARAEISARLDVWRKHI